MFVKRYFAQAGYVSILRDLIFIVGAANLSIVLIGNYLKGGHSYQQGDWLINGVNDDIRRGYFGSALIRISDFTGADLLLVLVALQIALVCALFFYFRKAAEAVKSPVIGYLLSVSPGLFSVLWLVETGGAARKELIAFAGLALFATGILYARRTALALGAFVFAAGFWAHETTTFLMPAFLGIAAVSWYVTELKRWLIVLTAAVTVSACLALLHALTHSHIPDVAGVCQPLLERGLDENICSGAIVWLDLDLAHAREFTAGKATWQDLMEFSAAYLFALAPLAFVISRLGRRRLYVAFAILSAVPFILLCFIAIDWGRWISMHVFSVALLLIVAIGGEWEQIRHPVRLQKPVDIIVMILVSVIFFLFAPPYMI